MKIDFTRSEILKLRSAIRIATEDGSIYGDDSRNKTINAQLERISAKLDAALPPKRRRKK